MTPLQVAYTAASRQRETERQRNQLRGVLPGEPDLTACCRPACSYLVVFDEISEEGLIALSPLWVLGIVFGLAGLTIGRHSLKRSVIAAVISGVAALPLLHHPLGARSATAVDRAARSSRLVCRCRAALSNPSSQSRAPAHDVEQVTRPCGRRQRCRHRRARHRTARSGSRPNGLIEFGGHAGPAHAPCRVDRRGSSARSSARSPDRVRVLLARRRRDSWAWRWSRARPGPIIAMFVPRADPTSSKRGGGDERRRAGRGQAPGRAAPRPPGARRPSRRSTTRSPRDSSASLKRRHLQPHRHAEAGGKDRHEQERRQRQVGAVHDGRAGSWPHRSGGIVGARLHQSPLFHQAPLVRRSLRATASLIPLEPKRRMSPFRRRSSG